MRLTKNNIRFVKMHYRNGVFHSCYVVLCGGISSNREYRYLSDIPKTVKAFCQEAREELTELNETALILFETYTYKR